METSEKMQYKKIIPVLPLRDVVVFPRMVVSLYVGRQMSLRALEVAMKEGGQIFLVAQTSAKTENPDLPELHSVGCKATVLQMLRLPDDNVKILVEGMQRCNAVYQQKEGDDQPIYAEIFPLDLAEDVSPKEAIALQRALTKLALSYARSSNKTSEELQTKIEETEDLGKLTDLIVSSMPLMLKDKQRLFEMSSLSKRTAELIKIIRREQEVQKIDKKIRGRVKEQVEKSHREYYLQEQARAIQKELGDEQGMEIEDFKKRLKESGMPEQAYKKCEQEIKKLQMMSAMSAEASVTRTYIENLLSVPWQQKSEISGDLIAAKSALDADHYGLEKVKERILEYLAVQRRAPNGKSPILCLVGPPGVGKTSLGRSIATATGRVFGRISLGGVRDEAEIRGHRRTYIGAMPGKIIHSLVRAKVQNPLILLDEIDKMGIDFRGDPAAALLEVLDPEQNKEFGDHYLDVDYDLSQVMFITTANSLNIPPALQDRLEIIRLSGYTEEEKVNIATNHLIGRQLQENGLNPSEAQIKPEAIRDIIRYYTRESGVRNLERDIGTICRKLVYQLDVTQPPKSKKATATTATAKPTAKKAKIIVKAADLQTHLGVKKFSFGRSADESRVGQVNGMAWTEVGGDLLSVESCCFPGKGEIIRTGKLGEVMQESVAAAFSVVRARADKYQLTAEQIKKQDYHIHFPEGAIPKDGPSAGIAIATAILSTLCNVAVASNLAMTGEITLRGEVLPVGGIKEKLLAAARGGITHVIIPKENEKDLSEIPDNIKAMFKISLVKWIEEVFALSFVQDIEAQTAAPTAAKLKSKKPRAKKTIGGTPLLQ